MLAPYNYAGTILGTFVSRALLLIQLSLDKSHYVVYFMKVDFFSNEFLIISMNYAVETDDTSLQICNAILSADQLDQQVQILAFKKYVLLWGGQVVDGVHTFFLNYVTTILLND